MQTPTAQVAVDEGADGVVWAVTPESLSRFCKVGFSYFFTVKCPPNWYGASRTNSLPRVNCVITGSYVVSAPS